MPTKRKAAAQIPSPARPVTTAAPATEDTNPPFLRTSTTSPSSRSSSGSSSTRAENGRSCAVLQAASADQGSQAQARRIAQAVKVTWGPPRRYGTVGGYIGPPSYGNGPPVLCLPPGIYLRDPCHFSAFYISLFLEQCKNNFRLQAFFSFKLRSSLVAGISGNSPYINLGKGDTLAQKRLESPPPRSYKRRF
eukprot:155249-Pelagomonas_calceolata.AAC.1